MNKKIKKICFFVLFLAIVLFSQTAYCANGSLKASQTTSGNKITVTITSTKALGAYEVKVSGLTPINGESDVGAFGGSSIAGASVAGTKNLGKFIFNVPNKDTKVTFSVSGAQDKDGKDVTISSTSLTLKAKKTSSNNSTTTKDKPDTSTTSTKKSNNAYLSTLGVTPKEYDFSGFSKNKTSYNVTVPSDVNSLKVSYKTENAKATVKVSGNSGFEVGSNNKIKVVVTAEDGKTTKTYTIKVTKMAEEEEKPGNIINETKGLYLQSLTIEGLELTPEFSKDTYSYTAQLSQADVTDLEVNAVPNKDDATVEISGNTGLVEGENTINIILTQAGSTEQVVYQIVVDKNSALPVSSGTTEVRGNDTQNKLKTYLGVVIGAIVFIIVAVIVLICLLRRENKRLEEENEGNIGDKDVDEYDVYKNDMNEFEDKTGKEENFIESLYEQRNQRIKQEEPDKETIEEIDNQTKEIFKEKSEKTFQNNQTNVDTTLEEDSSEIRRNKGRHF